MNMRGQKRDPSAIRVLIVEDDADTRERLGAGVKQASDVAAVALAADAASAREWLRSAHADAALVDLGLPDADGTELISEIRKATPQTKVMVISVFGDEAHLVRALEAGATGYLLKDATAAQIREALGELMRGGAPFSPAVAVHLLRRFAPPPDTNGERKDSDLTGREQQVLELLARGATYQEIGTQLRISLNTVRTYIRQIYRKLEVSSRGSAVHEAYELDLIRR